ncbi:MAG: hypothetical protein LUF85_15340 [Bacteroides sp.]|nr:hypothetical protein [Bacteroides sp.]
MKKIIPVGVEGLDINMVIVNEMQVYPLNEYESLTSVMRMIFEKENKLLTYWIPKNSTLINDINFSTKEKCIYFVGSKPTHMATDGLWEEKVHFFVQELVNKLLKQDFKLASFPSVDHIGKLVAKQALQQGESKYEIAGLYKFDTKTKKFQDLKKLNINNAWEKTIEKFRRFYLENKDCMIIIGGGENTKKEYEVAKTINTIQVFPIPCFGGFGKELYEKLKHKGSFRNFTHPCHQCTPEPDRKACPYIESFVSRFKKYQLIKDDH